jgi:hypothetical protein
VTLNASSLRFAMPALGAAVEYVPSEWLVDTSDMQVKSRHFLAGWVAVFLMIPDISNLTCEAIDSSMKCGGL